MKERRRCPRYSIFCPIEYRCEDNRPIDSSITLNMSEGGALISTRDYIEPGTKLIIKISLKGEDFFIRGKVVHIHPREGEKFYNLGIEFLQNQFEFINKFYEEIEAIMLFQRECNKEAGHHISIEEASMKWYKSAPHLTKFKLIPPCK